MLIKKHIRIEIINWINNFMRFSYLQTFQQFSHISRLMTMASTSSIAGKKLIRIDISSDPICCWCFVGKKNLEKAIALSEYRFDFEIKWHPYQLFPTAPKEGVNKAEFFMNRYGARSLQWDARNAEIFKGFGLDYNSSKLTGNTIDSHRLIYFAGHQGLDKQNKLVEELFIGYFVRGKYIGDREFLAEAAKMAGVEGASEFLADPNNGLKEVNEDLKRYSGNISSVPHYLINGKHQLSGGQPPETFLRAFQTAARD